MLDNEKKLQNQEMDTLGTAFMGFIMGIGTILGIWFLVGLVQVISKIIA